VRLKSLEKRLLEAATGVVPVSEKAAA
jgi:hypothetical protein